MVSPLGGKRRRAQLSPKCAPLTTFRLPRIHYTRKMRGKRVAIMSGRAYQVFIRLGYPLLSVSHLVSRQLSFGLGTLEIQQALFALEAPTIAAETLIFPHNSMTRNHECNRIRRAGASDRTHGAGFTE